MTLPIATSFFAERPGISSRHFLDAVAGGEIDKVRGFLAEEPRLVTSRDPSGVSALLLAAYHYQDEVLELLLGTGVELDVFEAAAAGRRDRVAALLAVDPGLARAVSPDGFSPLGLAAFFGRFTVLELLIDRGADPSAPSHNALRVTPLHSAVAHRDGAKALAMARLLLKAGATVNAVQAGGFTPLHQAAAAGNEELVRLLLASGAAYHVESDQGKTPRDLAAERGHQHLLPLLGHGR